MLVKKYGNRRLYDTETSRYVTLEEIAERVHLGEDIQVVDAKSGHDLTQTVLAQLILESRGAAKLLPVPLLKQLIRMRDDALAEFFGRYVTWALEVYLRLRSSSRSVLPFDPFAGMSMAPPLLSRFFGGRREERAPTSPSPEPEVEDDGEGESMEESLEADAAPAKEDSEIDDLRREIAELRDVMRDALAARSPSEAPAKKVKAAKSKTTKKTKTKSKSKATRTKRTKRTKKSTG